MAISVLRVERLGISLIALVGCGVWSCGDVGIDAVTGNPTPDAAATSGGGAGGNAGNAGAGGSAATAGTPSGGTSSGGSGAVGVKGGAHWAPLNPNDLPPGCDEKTIQEAEVCVGNVSTTAGTQVKVPVYALQPAGCQGIQQANMQIELNEQYIKLVPEAESGNICGRLEELTFGSPQYDYSLWYCPWHFTSANECDALVPSGRVWVLTVDVLPGTPPGSYKITGRASVGGGVKPDGYGDPDPKCSTVNYQDPPLAGGVITVTP